MFYPTHRHADGGLYQYLGPQLGRLGTWTEGVAYKNEEGMMFWTTETRWGKRFVEIKGGSKDVIEIPGEEGVIGAFSFSVHEAGDIRHMLISAHPMPNAAPHISREFVDFMKRVLFTQAEAVTRGLHVRDHDFPDLIGDVAAFHAKFGQEYIGKPRQLPDDLHDFRIKFHEEETHEYRDEYPRLCDAIVRKDRRDIINSMELQLDALCDAAWVILGTADLQFGRRAFIEAWRRVVKANMAKVIATDDPNAEDSGREIKYDIRKPAGWLAPDHRDLVQDNAIFDEIFGSEEAVEIVPTNYSDTRVV